MSVVVLGLFTGRALAEDLYLDSRYDQAVTQLIKGDYSDRMLKEAEAALDDGSTDHQELVRQLYYWRVAAGSLPPLSWITSTTADRRTEWLIGRHQDDGSFWEVQLPLAYMDVSGFPLGTTGGNVGGVRWKFFAAGGKPLSPDAPALPENAYVWGYFEQNPFGSNQFFWYVTDPPACAEASHYVPTGPEVRVVNFTQSVACQQDTESAYAWVPAGVTKPASTLHASGDATASTQFLLGTDRDLLSSGRQALADPSRAELRAWVNALLAAYSPDEDPATRDPSLGPYPDEQPGGSNPALNNKPCDVADPVVCVSGNLYEQVRDLAVAGRGPSLQLTRRYNALFAQSTTSADGRLGAGWTDTYAAHLQFIPSANRVLVHQGDGSTVTFTRAANGTLTAPNYAHASLSQAASGDYLYRLRDQTEYHFDQSGVLQKISDRNGYQASLAYDGDGRLAHVTDEAGRSLDFAYNAEDELSSVTDPAGNRVGYDYDADNNLTAVTDVDGNITRYRYDERHLIVDITDPRGGKTQNDFDAKGRVVVQTDASDATTRFDYDYRVTTVTDPRGDKTRFNFNHGLLTSRTIALGTPQEATWSYSYDSADNPTGTTSPEGRTTFADFDSQGNQTRINTPSTPWTTITYNARHDPLTITDRMGEVTTFAYDANGNPTSISRPLAGTSDVATQTFSYDPDHSGQLVASTDANGNTTHYEYDAKGNRTATIDPEGDKTTYDHDALGRLVKQVSPRGNATGADPGQYTETIERTASGRPKTITDRLGGVTRFSYDDNGNLTKRTAPNGHETSYSYDADDRRTEVKRGDATTTRFRYDTAGNRTAVIDGRDQATEFAYDAADRLIRRTDPLNHSVSYGYDRDGLQTSKANARGQTTTYTYRDDTWLQKIDYEDPDTLDVSFDYDRVGRMIKMDSGYGHTTELTYDSLGRLTKANTPMRLLPRSGTNTNQLYETGYHWDLGGRLTNIDYPVGAASATLTSGLGAPTRVTRGYDHAGRLTSVSDWLGHTTRFEYDPDGNLTKQTYPNGIVAARTFDRANRVSRILDTGPDGTLMDLRYGRDPSGQLTDTQLPAASPALTERYAYDGADRLTQASIPTAAGTDVTTNSYAYDAADRITTISRAGSPLNLRYDDADELTRAEDPVTGTAVATYGFDADGNRASATNPQTATHGDYSYDEAGRLTMYENRVQTTVNSGLTATHSSSPILEKATDATYEYSPDGLRVDLLWDRSQALPLVIGDTQQNAYITGPGGLPVEQITVAGTISYYHQDQLGSTRALTDKDGHQLASYAYDPYGNQVNKTQPVAAPFGYAGQWTDPDTGLIYLRNRFYEPRTGQFLTRDPIGFRGEDQNLYGYARRNPLAYVDPSGLTTLSADGSRITCGDNRAATLGGALPTPSLTYYEATRNTLNFAMLAGMCEFAQFAFAPYGVVGLVGAQYFCAAMDALFWGELAIDVFDYDDPSNPQNDTTGFPSPFG